MLTFHYLSEVNQANTTIPFQRKILCSKKMYKHIHTTYTRKSEQIDIICWLYLLIEKTSNKLKTKIPLTCKAVCDIVLAAFTNIQMDPVLAWSFIQLFSEILSSMLDVTSCRKQS